jgi:hypothetical protein
MNIGSVVKRSGSAGKRNGMNHQRKSILEKYGGIEGLIREVEGNPGKYNKYWSKPWTSYT